MSLRRAGQPARGNRLQLRQRLLDDLTLARLPEAHPNLIVFKDGVADIELLARMVMRLGDRLTITGGMPTAETYALPYRLIGVPTYSSAVFNFALRSTLDFLPAVPSTRG